MGKIECEWEEDFRIIGKRGAFPHFRKLLRRGHFPFFCLVTNRKVFHGYSYKNTFSYVLMPSANCSWRWTLTLRIMSQCFNHCATIAAINIIILDFDFLWVLFNTSCKIPYIFIIDLMFNTCSSHYFQQWKINQYLVDLSTM